MAKATRVRDPYRGDDVTFREFAIREGVRKCAASQFHRRHGTLEGFRERAGGVKPHTFMHNGAFVNIAEAARLCGASMSTVVRLKGMGPCEVGDLAKAVERMRLERSERLRKALYKGAEVRIKDFAASRGVSCNAVTLWANRHGNTLDGFDGRRPSRLNQTLHRHSGLNVSKSEGGWAAHFGVTRGSIRHWLKSHDDMKGYEEWHRSPCAFVKRGRPCRMVKWRGMERSVAHWSKVMNVSEVALRRRLRTHGTLDGYVPRRRRGGPSGAAGPENGTPEVANGGA